MAQTMENGGKEEKPKSRISNRGFASMSPEQQRQIASKGGQAAHKKGVAHEWTSEEARAAGRKGGQASKKGTKPETRAGELDNDHKQTIENSQQTPKEKQGIHRKEDQDLQHPDQRRERNSM